MKYNDNDLLDDDSDTEEEVVVQKKENKNEQIIKEDTKPKPKRKRSNKEDIQDKKCKKDDNENKENVQKQKRKRSSKKPTEKQEQKQDDKQKQKQDDKQNDDKKQKQEIDNNETKKVEEQINPDDINMEELENGIMEVNKTLGLVEPKLTFNQLFMKSIHQQIQDINKNIEHKDEWPSMTPIDIKVEFILSMPLFNRLTYGNVIAKFVYTMDTLLKTDKNVFMEKIQKLYSSKDCNDIFDMIQWNIHYASLVNPNETLKNTKYETKTLTEWKLLCDHLLHLNRENLRLFKEMNALYNHRIHGEAMPAVIPMPPPLSSGASDIEETPVEKLLDFLLDIAANKGLRRTDKAIYQEVVINPGNTKTRFFQLLSDFKTWIYDTVGSKTEHRDEFHFLLSRPGIVKHLEELFEWSRDPRLPRLVERRTLFSFDNGIFDAATGFFHVYHTDKDMPDYVHTIEELDPNECSANYWPALIPVEIFKPGYDLSQIKTPTWDKIFKDQGWSDFDLERFEAFSGRNLHNIGSKDDTQTCLWIYGPGGTGKGCYARGMAKIYPKDKIGFISDDVEKEFTDQHLLGSYFIIGLDVSEDLGVSATRFNSWVSGEQVVIKRKHLMAIVEKWIAPLICISNTLPAIKSNAGSGSRRFTFWQFGTIITSLNTELEKYMEQELPLYVVKIGLRYLALLKILGTKGVWEPGINGETILPKMCYDGRKEYTCRVSPPDAFFETCDELEFGNDYTITTTELKKLYNFWKSQNGSHFQRSKNFIMPDFSPLNFKVAITHRNMDWNSVTNIITGCRKKVRK